MKIAVFTAMFFFTVSSICFAGEPRVLKVRVEKTGGHLYQVWATIQHDDEGWEHYADRWEILDMQGNLLDTRTLLHPHTSEPFTRSIERANIPRGIARIKIRAHDNVHGYSNEELYINLP